MAEAARAVDAALGELRAIGDFVSCPLNPRKTFDSAKLKELADSMRSVGVLEPLIARSRPGNTLEIIAGERRWRAAKIAELTDLPVIVKSLTDVQALEVMTIENSQRADVHPLEEAEGYLTLMKLEKSYTPAAIATKIGMSLRYVQQRLQLARLSTPVKTAFMEGKIATGHADLISRLKPVDQAAALKACFQRQYGGPTDEGCISVRNLDGWIEDNVRIELSKDDPQLMMFPDLAKTVETPEAASKILQVAGGYIPESLKTKVLAGALDKDAYRRVRGKSDRCKFAQRAVVVIGTDRGKFIDVCTSRTECKTHWSWEIQQTERKAKHQERGRSSGTHPSRNTGKERKAAAAAKAKAAAQAAIGERRQKALERAVAQLRKTTIKPGAAVLAVLKETMGYVSGSTWGALVATLIDENLFVTHDAGWKKGVALLKPFGVRLDVIEKDLAAADDEKASKVALKKPLPPGGVLHKALAQTSAKNKPAREFLEKGARAGVLKALAKRVKKVRTVGKGKK